MSCTLHSSLPVSLSTDCACFIKFCSGESERKKMEEEKGASHSGPNQAWVEGKAAAIWFTRVGRVSFGQPRKTRRTAVWSPGSWRWWWSAASPPSRWSTLWPQRSGTCWSSGVLTRPTAGRTPAAPPSRPTAGTAGGADPGPWRGAALPARTGRGVGTWWSFRGKWQWGPLQSCSPSTAKYAEHLWWGLGHNAGSTCWSLPLVCL